MRVAPSRLAVRWPGKLAERRVALRAQRPTRAPTFRARLKTLVLGVLLLAAPACAARPLAPEDLDLVAHAAPPPAPEVRHALLEIELTVTAFEGSDELTSADGPPRLRIPLPPDEPDQALRSVTCEAGPPGAIHIERGEEDDERWLTLPLVPGVRTEVLARTELELRPLAATPIRPEISARLPQLSDPLPKIARRPEEVEAWLSQARAQGLHARRVYGAVPAPDGARVVEWLEIRLPSDPAWTRLGDGGPGPLPTPVRLGTGLPHVEGAKALLDVRYTLRFRP